MDCSENTEGFNRVVADQLYQLLLDLNENGTSNISIDPRALLSSEVDTIAAVDRSAALEKEAKDILKVFTNAPVTPVFREVNTLNSNERAIVPRKSINIVKEGNTFKIDIWKNELLVSSIRNDRLAPNPMHFINIRIDATGSFIISGLENIGEDIKEIIRELGGLIAIEDYANFPKNGSNGVEIKEITDDDENEVEMVEVPMPDGILRFSVNQNPIDVLMEIYCTEETEDNKKIFKVPELGEFVVSPQDDPITVFKLITGFDLTDYYKTSATENDSILDVPAIEYNTENKENLKVKNTSRGQRHKKNKRKSKKKK